VAAECGKCTANPTGGFFVQRQLPVRLALDAQLPTLPFLPYQGMDFITQNLSRDKGNAIIYVNQIEIQHYDTTS
jgi:hypothetical protein